MYFLFKSFLSSLLSSLGVLGLALLARLRRGASTRLEPIGDSGIIAITNFFVAIYAARIGDDVILFDTGIDPHGRPIDRLLGRLAATRANVRHVFLTHAHPDHVAAASLFPDAEIHAGAADVSYLAHRSSFRRLAVRVFGRIVRSRPVLVSAPIQGDVAIDVGQAEHVRAIPCPGDTPGSTMYLFRRVLIAGDCLALHRGRLQLAPDWAMEDPIENLRSIAALPEALGESKVDVICTSHGGHAGSQESAVAKELLNAVASRASRALSDTSREAR